VSGKQILLINQDLFQEKSCTMFCPNKSKKDLDPKFVASFLQTRLGGLTEVSNWLKFSLACYKGQKMVTFIIISGFLKRFFKYKNVEVKKCPLYHRNLMFEKANFDYFFFIKSISSKRTLCMLKPITFDLSSKSGTFGH